MKGLYIHFKSALLTTITQKLLANISVLKQKSIFKNYTENFNERLYLVGIKNMLLLSIYIYILLIMLKNINISKQ